MPPSRGSNGVEGRGRPKLSSIPGLWRGTFAPEYLGFAILLFLYLMMVFFVEPFHRMFSISDLNISYPHADVQRVPVTLNFVYSLFLPLAILVLYNLLTHATPHKHESTYLPLLISLVLTSFITDLIKNAVGRPRPDLLARCKPLPSTSPSTLVTIAVCTETDHHLLHDGWRSFPSGHSSFAFAGLGFLSFFLAGQLRIFRHAYGGRDLSRSLLCIAPLLGAAMIAISRCEDYRHDVYDVCVGSLLGVSIAYWSYRRHWPHLSSKECDEPYPRPGAVTQQGWNRIRDEESGVAGLHDVGSEMPELR
ncbi:related to diacylglycerol pyrophosphate phosphatase [Cephalotrichum gorgonifer]|uniref:Related to diacylglycerol pyrophosphate phosphatase n=1 Tax=Cephalotrichum gorgonifer TaxID=2041049 RepID=A0AAE8N1I6_9PEZI|nr:related to diacylglycerol pyrophosphate phosphatase [Cephalotrichum gorgonifer]